MCCDGKKEVYDQMLRAFEGLAFPLAVVGVTSDDETKQMGFASVWLPALEHELTSSERVELERAFKGVSRVMLPAFLRLVEKNVDPRFVSD